MDVQVKNLKSIKNFLAGKSLPTDNKTIFQVFHNCLRAKNSDNEKTFLRTIENFLLDNFIETTILFGQRVQVRRFTD